MQQQLGKNAKLTVDAFDRAAQKKITSGVLLTLDNQIDTTTGTVKARASFDNKDALLFPNEFVNVRLLVDTLRGVTLIPASAIQHNGQAAFVYILQDNTAHMRSITARRDRQRDDSSDGNQSRRCAGQQQLRQAAGKRESDGGRKSEFRAAGQREA